MKLRFLASALAGAAILSAPAVGQAAQIVVSSVTASSTYFSYDVNHLIDGSGLSGAFHDGDYRDKWMTDGTATGWLVFDLGGAYSLTGAEVWNYSGGCCGFTRSVRNLHVSTSLDGVTYGSGADFVLRYTSADSFLGESLVLGGAARYVRFDIGSNYGGLSSGLSEVQFFDSRAAVPEPATWAMLLLGFGLAGSGLRRRARAVAA